MDEHRIDENEEGWWAERRAKKPRKKEDQCRNWNKTQTTKQEIRKRCAMKERRTRDQACEGAKIRPISGSREIARGQAHPAGFRARHTSKTTPPENPRREIEAEVHPGVPAASLTAQA
jgi:hypothetical protein